MYVERRRRKPIDEPKQLGMEVFDMADALLKSQQDLIEQQVRTIEALTDTIIELRSKDEHTTKLATHRADD